MTTGFRNTRGWVPVLALALSLQGLGTGVAGAQAQPAPAQPAVQGAPAQARGPGPAMAPDPRVQVKSYRFTDTNEDMPYSLFVSSKVRPGQKAPLIVMLHGLGTNHAFMLRGSAIDQAEAGGYILVGPQGYNTSGWYGANFPMRPPAGATPPGAGAPRGPGTGPAPGAAPGGPPRPAVAPQPENVRELSEKDVMNVLAIVRREYTIDDQRIYLMGHSMGGAGTLHLVTKYPDIWAAAVAIAPAAFGQQPDSIKANPTLPLMLVHGLKDNVVPPNISQNWAAHLKAINHPHEYVEVPEAGHGMDIINVGYERMFPFFARHSRK